MPAIHIPGYNYCGPGTWDFTKKPINALDRACRRHDISYRKTYYQNNKKVSPYFHYTKSDARLQRSARKINSIPAKLVNTVFAIKKKITSRAYPIRKNSDFRKRYYQKRKTFQIW